MQTPQDVSRALAGEGYLADRGLATAVYLAAELEQPLLLEGEAGVGKTEVARALAGATGGVLSGVVVATSGYSTLALGGGLLALALVPALIWAQRTGRD